MLFTPYRIAVLLLAALAAGCGTAGGTLPSAAALSPEDAAPEPKAAVVAPDALVGMTADAVTGLFGPPTFLRREGPAQIWQYRSELCTVDLFLYLPADAAGDAAMRVAHADLRRPGAAKRNGAPEAAQGTRCLAELRDRNQSAQAG